jgi:tetratricopeptide (TPR) repeat protein
VNHHRHRLAVETTIVAGMHKEHIMSMNGDKRRSARPMLAALLGIVATIGLSSTMACAKAASVRAMLTLKEANQAYQSQDYKRAAQLYEQTIQTDPNQVAVYFFLGNSYDNLWKPGSKDPGNDELMTKAVQNYTLAAERIPTDTPENAHLKSLALQYLMAAYGPEKLDDPVKAEPVIIHLIELDPSEPANYFQLAKLYEDAGEYEAAEKALVRAKEVKPTEPNVYVQLANFYKRQDQFDKEMQALEERAQKEPNNPEAFQTIATQYWDQGYRGVGVSAADKKTYVDKGIVAVDRALQIRPDYVEALVYKNLLLRSQALLEKDPARQQQLLKEADTLRDKAEDIRKKKATGVSD